MGYHPQTDQSDFYHGAVTDLAAVVMMVGKVFEWHLLSVKEH